MPTPGAPTISQDLEFHARVVPLSWTTTEFPIVGAAAMFVGLVVAVFVGVFTAMIAGIVVAVLTTIACMAIRKAVGPSYVFDGLCILGLQGDEYGILGVNRRIRVFSPEPVPEWSGFRGGRRDLGTVDLYDLAYPILGHATPLSQSAPTTSRVVSASVSQRLDQANPVERMLGRRRHL